jgi:hypothetical protein
MVDEDFEDYFTFTKPAVRQTTKTKTHKGKAMDNALYEISDDITGVRFGTKLAENSLGKWVMEIKGTGVVEAIDPKKISKVMPYTIGVQFSNNGTIYHYLSKVGAVEKGAFYIVDGYNVSSYQMGRVVDVDTKSDKATKEFSYYQKIS